MADNDLELCIRIIYSCTGLNPRTSADVAAIIGVMDAHFFTTRCTGEEQGHLITWYRTFMDGQPRGQ